METREETAEHPLRRTEDCGASLKAIVSSQEVQSNRVRGEGAERERERTMKGRGEGRLKVREKERDRENENDKWGRREGSV